MRWLEAFHIVFMVSWFAGLFYLPRIFVYHAGHPTGPVHTQFCVMERKLYRFIMMPAMLLTLALGLALAVGDWFLVKDQLWFWIKMALVVLLVAYHFHNGYIVGLFARGENRHGHRFYRLYNEFPTIVLIAVIILVVVQP